MFSGILMQRESALAYLDQLPFDILKIDKALIDRLAVPGAMLGIVIGIVGIAHTVEKRVLAEFIEHARQAEVLRKLGCELGQGITGAGQLTAQSFRRWRRLDCMKNGYESYQALLFSQKCKSTLSCENAHDVVCKARLTL